MRLSLPVLLCATLACNGADRDSNPVSGSASASGGQPASETTGGAGSSSSGGGGDASASQTAAETETETDTDATTGSAGETGPGEGTATTSASTGTDGGSSGDESSGTSGGIVDGVLDINIIAHNDCTFTTNPASITVPEGTEFTVNWKSDPTSEVEFDIDKIDEFNAVPIVIDMDIGGEYHDEVRAWCGDLFTGTFDFRLRSCFDPHYIPVDCGG